MRRRPRSFKSARKFFIFNIILFSLIELAGWGMVIYVRTTDYLKLRTTSFYKNFVNTRFFRSTLPMILFSLLALLVLIIFIFIAGTISEKKRRKQEELNLENPPQKRRGHPLINFLVFVLTIGIIGGGVYLAYGKIKNITIDADDEVLLEKELYYEDFSDVQNRYVQDKLFETMKVGGLTYLNPKYYTLKYKEMVQGEYEKRFMQCPYDLGFRERKDRNSSRVDRRSVLGKEACSFRLNDDLQGYTVTNIYPLIIDESVKKDNSSIFGSSSLAKDEYNYMYCEIDIPETYEDLPVTKVDYLALREETVAFEEVNFPSTVKEIIGNHFDKEPIRSHTVKTVNLNEGLETIGEYCFLDVSDLFPIIIPSTVKSIGEGSLDGHKVLFKGDIVGDVSKAAYAYKIDDIQLTEIDGTSYGLIDNELVALGPSRHNDTYIHLKDEVEINGTKYPLTKIANKAFTHSEALKVDIPESVTSIGQEAFEGSNVRMFKLLNKDVVCGYHPFPTHSKIMLTGGIDLNNWAPLYQEDMVYRYIKGLKEGVQYHEMDGVTYVLGEDLMGPIADVFAVDPFVHEITIPNSFEIGKTKYRVEKILDYSLTDTCLKKIHLDSTCRVKENAILYNPLLKVITGDGALTIEHHAIEYADSLKEVSLSSVLELGANFRETRSSVWSTLSDGVYYLKTNGRDHGIALGFDNNYAFNNYNYFKIDSETQYMCLVADVGSSGYDKYSVYVPNGAMKSIYSSAYYNPMVFLQAKDVDYEGEIAKKIYFYSEEKIADGRHFHLVGGQPVIWTN